MYYRFATLIMLFLITTRLSGQESEIDSLTQVLRVSDSDTIKVKTYLDLARTYRKENQTDTAEAFVLQARELAFQADYHKGVAQSDWVLGDLDYDRDETMKAVAHYDESVKKFDSIGLDSLASLVRYNMGVLQLGVGMYRECLDNFAEVANQQRHSGDTLALIVTLGRMANAYQRKGDYDSSIAVSEQGLTLARAVDSPLRAALSLNNLGIVYRKKGETTKAIEYYRKALFFAEEGGNLFYQGAFLENIGIVHSNRGEYVTALNAYFDAMKRYEELEDEESLVILGFNIGLIYKLNQEYEKALPYYQESLEFDTSNQDTLGMINSMHNLGSAYLEMGDFEKAKSYLLGSYNIVIASQIECLDGIGGMLGKLYYEAGAIDSSEYFLNLELNSLSQCETYSNYPEVAYLLGLVNQSRGNDRKAYNLFIRSLTEAKNAGYQEVVKKSSFALYEWHKKRGANAKALKYHELFQQSTDSLFNRENTRKLAWLEANYQLDKVADSLTLVQENEARTLNATIKGQKRNQMLIMVCSVALVGILFALYLYLRKRRELKYQFEINEERNAGFKAVIIATEEERKRIAKDLHDGVVQQMAAIKLTLSNVLKGLPKDQADEVARAKIMTEAAAEETRSISHQMMPKVLIEVGLIPAMEEVISNSLASDSLKVEFQQHALKERYDNGIEIAVYRIFQELVNNVVKHSQAKQVDVQLMQNGGKLILIVEDDGVGMKGNKGGGIGLSNIESRLTTIDGKVDYASTENSGTVATIVIPL